MSQLPRGATIRQLQQYIHEHFRERGFEGNTPVQECLLLLEEVGELAKAIRKERGFRIDASSHVGSIQEELADIVWVSVAIANLYEVDLESAFIAKEELNHQRVWQ